MVDETKANSADVCLPKFFKVYLPDESGDDLVFPISFNSFLPKSFPKTVTVRSTSGKVWKMVLRKCGGEVEKYSLVNGWKRIVKGENLKGGDFLEFEFDGSRLFNFCIYELETMCKRLTKNSGQSKEVKVGSDSEEDTQASDDVFALDEDDDDGDDYAVFEVVEEDDAGAAFEDDDYLDDRLNPSFTVTLKYLVKKDQLLIPARVIKDYDLHFPESITLVDPLVENFGTMEKKITIWRDGRVLVKGFGSIIRRNKVKTTDKMMCEIKSKRTGNDNLVQTIKVHIISG